MDIHRLLQVDIRDMAVEVEEKEDTVKAMDMRMDCIHLLMVRIMLAQPTDPPEIELENDGRGVKRIDRNNSTECKDNTKPIST